MCIWGFPGGSVVKNLPAKQETRIQSLGQEYPLEKQMATPSSILAGEFPWDRGAWRATVHGVAKSWTWLSGYTAAQIWWQVNWGTEQFSYLSRVTQLGNGGAGVQTQRVCYRIQFQKVYWHSLTCIFRSRNLFFRYLFIVNIWTKYLSWRNGTYGGHSLIL